MAVEARMCVSNCQTAAERTNPQSTPPSKTNRRGVNARGSVHMWEEGRVVAPQDREVVQEYRATEGEREREGSEGKN